MKKLFTFLTLIFAITCLNAQQRTADLQVTAELPTGTVYGGVPFDVTCKIKNLGPDAIKATDTVIVFVQLNTTITTLYTVYSTTLALNEEKPFTAKTAVSISGPPGSVNVCSFVVLQNRATTDGVKTVNKSGCNTLSYVYKTGLTNSNADFTIEGINVYPNPVANETKITYSLSQNAKVKISVKDLAGREVMQIANENQATGVYEKNVDMSSLTSGIYFVEYLVGDKVYTSKLIKN